MANPAGWKTCDTADNNVCATAVYLSTPRFRSMASMALSISNSAIGRVASSSAAQAS